MSKYVIQITAKNEIRCLAVPDETKSESGKLWILQGLVGGNVEPISPALSREQTSVYLPHPEFGTVMLVDEEGWIKDSPVNRLAAGLCGQEFIFGNAVLVKLETYSDGEQGFGFFTAVEVIEVLAILYEAFENTGVCPPGKSDEPIVWEVKA
ncbi:MAG: hypothetical protein E7638_04720 [Ruminococcaceae bacterium]|nr:hypothetical protein [Oscillospiraceae bacterium]